jgi:hypothetical protein
MSIPMLIGNEINQCNAQHRRISNQFTGNAERRSANLLIDLQTQMQASGLIGSQFQQTARRLLEGLCFPDCPTPAL